MRELLERLGEDLNLDEAEQDYQKISKKVKKYLNKVVPKLSRLRDYLSQQRNQSAASKDVAIAVDALKKADKDFV